MRSLTILSLALVSVIGAAGRLQSRNERLLINKRQTSTADPCTNTCTPFITAATPCNNAASCLCTAAIIKDLQTCLNCLAAEGNAASLADDVTDVNQKCASAGLSVTIPASGGGTSVAAGGVAGTGAGAGAGAGSPASTGAGIVGSQPSFTPQAGLPSATPNAGPGSSAPTSAPVPSSGTGSTSSGSGTDGSSGSAAGGSSGGVPGGTSGDGIGAGDSGTTGSQDQTGNSQPGQQASGANSLVKRTQMIESGVGLMLAMAFLM